MKNWVGQITTCCADDEGCAVSSVCLKGTVLAMLHAHIRQRVMAQVIKKQKNNQQATVGICG